MIFLAVTMGFFAENIRESIVNNHRELKYIKALLRDIKNDSISLTNFITQNFQTIRNDSLLLVELKEITPNSIEKISTLCLEAKAGLDIVTSAMFKHQQ